MSLLRGLPLLLAGIAIGCGARALDPHDDGGGGSGSVDGGGSGADGLRDVRVIDTPATTERWIEPCGNSLLDPAEECDDGNKTAGDGCNAICQIECYQSCGACGATPCITTAVCGDGWLAPREACDDGNLANGDGCAGTCLAIEQGWRCPVSGHRCVPNCGDGRVVGPETCDDGNARAGDGCSDLCLVEPSGAGCGDGVLSGAEECDDGPGNSAAAGYGACTTDCRYAGYCGDGLTNGMEECDRGSANNNVTYGNKDGCAAGCVFPRFCGDGILDFEAGEQCDLGANNGRWDVLCTIDCKVLI